MKIFPENRINEIVSQNYKTAAVFRKNGIDFCCRSQRSIHDLMLETGLDRECFIAELEEVTEEITVEQPDFTSWRIDLIVDYIEQNHHQYIRQQIPVIHEYLEKMARSHGNKNPEFIRLRDLFQQAADLLSIHLTEEETILFPVVRECIQAGMTNITDCRKKIMDSIARIVRNEGKEHDIWKQIDLITSSGHPSINCNVAKVAFSVLLDFHQDLYLHLHLENHLLFPRIREI